MLTSEQLPIRIEVSRPRLVEGGRGVLRVRLMNVSGESLVCKLGFQGALTDTWRDTVTVLAPARTAERRVPTTQLVRGTYVLHISADIERSDGHVLRFTGQLDREVEALTSGAAPINVHIAGGDGAVIDASQLRLGQFDDADRSRTNGKFEIVELEIEPTESVLSRATLADQRGPRLHVVTGDQMFIGRDPERADLVASSGEVSGLHVELERVDERVVLKHRSRTNTTRLDESILTAERPITLSEDANATLVLGGTWQCRVRVFTNDGVVASLRHGLVERGVPITTGTTNSSGVAGVLFTPECEPGPDSVPMLWLSTAIQLAETGLHGVEDRSIHLSAFRGLQEIRLADDNRVLSLSDLRVGTQLPAGYCVVDGCR